MSAALGALACQKDSYSTSLKTKVVSCKQHEKKKDLFDVVLEDTVLFPEGGGQPRDSGKIKGIEVVDVQRKNGVCVHTVSVEKQSEISSPAAPFEVGEIVDVVLDWNSRFDRMQHHSGQHLLSAVCVKEYNFKTVSWNLGEVICQVELNTPQITQEQIDRIERIVNEEIRSCRPVKVKILSDKELSQDNPDKPRVTISSDDPNMAGPIRMIEIEGVDACTCCGTHVSNTSELQMIKLLHTEKTRGNTRLYFVVGNRVLKLAQRMLENERGLTQLLNTGANEHIDSVDRLQKQVTTYKKSLKSAYEELADLLAEKLLTTFSDKPAIFHHQEGADMEILGALSKPIMDKYGEKVIFMSGGDSSKGTGVFVMYGPEDKLKDLAPQVSKILEAKAGGKKISIKALQISSQSKI